MLVHLKLKITIFLIIMPVLLATISSIALAAQKEAKIEVFNSNNSLKNTFNSNDGSGNGDTSWTLESNGHGWKVTLTWHVKTLSLPSSLSTGAGEAGAGVSDVPLNYDPPYFIRWFITVDNANCGGKFTQTHRLHPPGQGHYEYPNSGHETVILAVPTNNPAYPHEYIQVAAYNGAACGDPADPTFQGVSIIDPEVASDVAGKAVALIPVPQLNVKANPGRGLVTIPAWFWLEQQDSAQWWAGTDPTQGGQPFGINFHIQPPEPSITQVPSPLTISVLIDATKFEWNFGDHSTNSTVVGTLLGKPYPQKSNVRHPYNSAGTYNPQVTITYVPRYSFNGSPFYAPAKCYQTIVLASHIQCYRSPNRTG